MTDATPSHSDRSPLAGIGLRLGATLSFALMAALIKLASDRGVTAPELVFYRSLFALPPLFVWIAASATPGRWRTRRPLAHVTRGAIGVTSMFLSFGALTLLPLAEAVTLSFIAPLFAVALSALIVVGSLILLYVALGNGEGAEFVEAVDVVGEGALEVVAIPAVEDDGDGQAEDRHAARELLVGAATVRSSAHDTLTCRGCHSFTPHQFHGRGSGDPVSEAVVCVRWPCR
mgnify:CR=1 FL=1